MSLKNLGRFGNAILFNGSALQWLSLIVVTQLCCGVSANASIYVIKRPITFTADGKSLVVYGEMKMLGISFDVLKVADPSTGKVLSWKRAPGGIYFLQACKNTDQVVSIDSDHIIFWQLPQLKKIKKTNIDDYDVTRVAVDEVCENWWSADNTTLTRHSLTPSGGKTHFPLPALDGKISALTARGNWMGLRTSKKKIALFDISRRNLKHILDLQCTPLWAPNISPNLKVFVATCLDSTTNTFVYDLESGKLLYQAAFESGIVPAFHLSDDGKFLAGVNFNHELQLIDLERNIISKVASLDDTAYSVALSRNQTYIAVGQEQNTLIYATTSKNKIVVQ